MTQSIQTITGVSASYLCKNTCGSLTAPGVNISWFLAQLIHWKVFCLIINCYLILFVNQYQIMG